MCRQVNETSHHIRVFGADKIHNAVKRIIAANRACREGHFTGEALLAHMPKHILNGQIGEQTVCRYQGT